MPFPSGIFAESWALTDGAVSDSLLVDEMGLPIETEIETEIVPESTEELPTDDGQ